MVFRVGLVGLGMAVTPHAKSLIDLGDRVEVAYAFSPSAERRRAFAQKFVAAGKHILLEKPLEISTARAEELVRNARGVKLAVVLQHRFRPAAEKLRSLLPALGKIVSASAAIPNWRPQSYYDQPGRGTRARDGGGVLLTQGIHTLDLLLSFCGEAVEVKSFAATTALEERRARGDPRDDVGLPRSPGAHRAHRRRPDGLSARLASRRARRFSRCHRKGSTSPSERRRSAQGSPLHRHAAADAAICRLTSSGRLH